MVAVPAVTPVTTPLEFTVATAVDELVHAPPVEPSVNVVDAPVHTDEAPEMVPGVAGAASTVIPIVTDVDPQLLVTV